MSVPERQKETEQLDAKLFPSLPLHILKCPFKIEIYYYLDNQRKAIWAFIPAFSSPYLKACEVPAVTGRKVSPRALKQDETNPPITALVLAPSLARTGFWQRQCSCHKGHHHVNTNGQGRTLRLWGNVVGWPLFCCLHGSRHKGSGAEDSRMSSSKPKWARVASRGQGQAHKLKYPSV